MAPEYRINGYCAAPPGNEMMLITFELPPQIKFVVTQFVVLTATDNCRIEFVSANFVNGAASEPMLATANVPLLALTLEVPPPATMLPAPETVPPFTFKLPTGKLLLVLISRASRKVELISSVAEPLTFTVPVTTAPAVEEFSYPASIVFASSIPAFNVSVPAAVPMPLLV